MNTLKELNQEVINELFKDEININKVMQLIEKEKKATKVIST